MPEIPFREMSVPVIQPDGDGFARKRSADDEIEIVVAVDVDESQVDGVVSRFERDVANGLTTDRKVEAVRVAIAAAGNVIGDSHIGLSIGVEVADDRRPPERSGGIPESERRWRARDRLGWLRWRRCPRTGAAVDLR